MVTPPQLWSSSFSRINLNAINAQLLSPSTTVIPANANALKAAAASQLILFSNGKPTPFVAANALEFKTALIVNTSTKTHADANANPKPACQVWGKAKELVIVSLIIILDFLECQFQETLGELADFHTTTLSSYIFTTNNSLSMLRFQLSESSLYYKAFNDSFCKWYLCISHLIRKKILSRDHLKFVSFC